MMMMMMGVEDEEDGARELASLPPTTVRKICSGQVITDTTSVVKVRLLYSGCKLVLCVGLSAGICAKCMCKHMCKYMCKYMCQVYVPSICVVCG